MRSAPLEYCMVRSMQPLLHSKTAPPPPLFVTGEFQRRVRRGPWCWSSVQSKMDCVLALATMDSSRLRPQTTLPWFPSFLLAVGKVFATARSDVDHQNPSKSIQIA
jgi:hypothetical protein